MQRSVQLITLHCVLMAAEEGSILAASRRAGMHHSALSRRIQELEHILGVTLFERYTGGVRPTEAGEQFLDRLGTILADLDSTLNFAEEVGNSNNGSLLVGFEESVSVSQVLDVTGVLNDKPKLDVRFKQGQHEDLIEALDRQELDLVISFGSDPDASEVGRRLWRDSIFVAASDGSHLAAGATIDWSQLSGETMLIAERVNASWGESLVGLLKPCDTPQAVVQHDVREDCLLALVREGLGITLLRESELPSDQDGLVAIPLVREGEQIRISCFVYWRSDNSNPILPVFVKFLCDRYPDS